MGWGLGEWGWSRDSGGRLGLWSSRLEKRLGGDGMVVRLTPEEGVPIGLGARDDTHTQHLPIKRVLRYAQACHADRRFPPVERSQLYKQEGAT